jgi:uncharacterized membrane protein YedE/YeeE
MNTFLGNWDWYIAGPLIGLFVPMLLLYSNKSFGTSSSFDYMCAMVAPKNHKQFFSSISGSNAWKVYFAVGIAIGGFVSVFLLSSEPVQFLPEKYYSPLGFLQLLVGGILVGFGTRYANGCTSGHTITGLSLLNLGSLKSTISFFVGGLIYTYVNMILF